MHYEKCLNFILLTIASILFKGNSALKKQMLTKCFRHGYIYFPGLKKKKISKYMKSLKMCGVLLINYCGKQKSQ